VKSATCEQVNELGRGREGLISGQSSSYARPRRRALQQGVPASCGASSRSEWLSAVIHCADQGFHGSDSQSSRQRMTSLFSSAVRRRPGQLVLELRCDGDVERIWALKTWTNEERVHASFQHQRPFLVHEDGGFLGIRRGSNDEESFELIEQRLYS